MRPTHLLHGGLEICFIVILRVLAVMQLHVVVVVITQIPEVFIVFALPVEPSVRLYRRFCVHSAQSWVFVIAWDGQDKEGSEDLGVEDCEFPCKQRALMIACTSESIRATNI